MLKLGRVTKGKMLFLLLVFVLNFDLFEFSAAILEKGLFLQPRGRGEISRTRGYGRKVVALTFAKLLFHFKVAAQFFIIMKVTDKKVMNSYMNVLSI